MLGLAPRAGIATRGDDNARDANPVSNKLRSRGRVRPYVNYSRRTVSGHFQLVMASSITGIEAHILRPASSATEICAN